MNKYKVNKKISQKRSRNKYFSFFLFFFLPIVIFIVALIFFLNLSSFRIKEIKIDGDEFLNKEKISKIIEKELSNKNFLYISNKNFLFYPEDKLKKELKKEFIEIDDIDISYKSLINLKEIDIKIKQKQKKYL